MSETSDFLRPLPYFSTLSSEEIEQVAEETVELFFAKGQILSLEGEPCQGLYVVKSGQIRVFKSSLEGRE